MNTLFRIRFLRSVSTLVLTALVTAMPAHATLLVYEGFNGYTTGALAGQKPNGNTVGLDAAVGYYDDGGNRTSGYTIQSAGSRRDRCRPAAARSPSHPAPTSSEQTSARPPTRALSGAAT